MKKAFYLLAILFGCVTFSKHKFLLSQELEQV